MKRLLMACIMVLSIATVSYAADEIIFRVPVELVSLHPNVRKVSIACMVFSIPDRKGHSKVLGRAEKILSIPIRDQSSTNVRDIQINSEIGRFYVRRDPSGVTDISGIVIVRVEIDENHTLGEAKSYECRFKLIGLPVPGRAWAYPVLQNKASADDPVWAQADPDKPFVEKVYGTLHKQLRFINKQMTR